MGHGEGWGEGEGQGHGDGAGGGDWNYGLFGCLRKPLNCLCGTFCFPCQVCQSANSLGESGLLYVLLSCVMPCIPLLLLRSKVRDQYAIEGDTCGDAVVAFCCTGCATCQLANEIEDRQK